MNNNKHLIDQRCRPTAIAGDYCFLFLEELHPALAATSSFCALADAAGAGSCGWESAMGMGRRCVWFLILYANWKYGQSRLVVKGWTLMMVMI